MENGQDADVSTHQSLMVPLNQRNQVRGHNDLMARRLKNRERQRRYRARKRLEAEKKRVRTSPLLQHHEADIREAHTSVPLPQDTHVVSQRKKTGIKDSSTTVAIEMPVNDTPQAFATRVHCQRDWKKDARRVHLYKEQEVRSKDHFALKQTAVGGNQIPPFPSGTNFDPPLDGRVQSSAPLLENTGTRRAVPGRRHWKAEARNKKT